MDTAILLPDTSMLGAETAVGRIDGALRELWDNNHAVTRASLINFAIYSERTDCLRRNTGLIAEITREHACRAILIASQPGAQEREVRAWITAHCQLDGSGAKSICSEQVSFLIRGAGAAVIRNIVFAHLDSDLPLVFWWQGDLTDMFEERLYSLINRLVIDSGSWSDPVAQFERLERAHDDSDSRFVVYDLSWARLFPLRLALAGVFDDLVAQEELPALEAIEIVQGTEPRQVETALFLTWMAHRARWKMRERSASGFDFVRKGGAPVRCTIHPADTDAKADEETEAKAEATGCAEDGSPAEGVGAVIARLTLRSPRAEITIAPTPDGRFFRSIIRVGSHHESEQLHPMGPTTTSGLVTDQLRRGGTNPAYFKLLRGTRSLLA